MAAYRYGQRLRRRGVVSRHRLVAFEIIAGLTLVGAMTAMNAFAESPAHPSGSHVRAAATNGKSSVTHKGGGVVTQKGNKPATPSTSSKTTAAVATSAQARTAAWEQDFTKMPAGGLDAKTWHYELDPSVPGRNNEQQAYTNSTNNVRIEPGTGLVIEARREPYAYPGTTKQFGYTSGRIDTRNSFTFTHGTLEAEIKLPKGAGTWPAFWLLSANQPNTSPLHPTDAMWNQPRFYLKDGELDISEHYGAWPGTVEGSAHTFTSSRQADVAVPDYGDQFHTYGVQVTPTTATWTLDGKPYGTVTRTSASTDDWPFQEGNKLYIILNLAMGGMAGGAIDNAGGPWKMYVKNMHFYPL